MLSNGDRMEKDTLLLGVVEAGMSFIALKVIDLSRLYNGLLQDVLLGARRSLFLDARGQLLLEALQVLS